MVVSIVMNVVRKRAPLGTWSPLKRTMDQLGGFHLVNELRVVWSPSEENDRMSSAELEVIYPELEKVRLTKLGRVGCKSCHAVYAAELEQCPFVWRCIERRCAGGAGPLSVLWSGNAGFRNSLRLVRRVGQRRARKTC